MTIRSDFVKKIIIILTLLFLTACSSNKGETLHFQGEGDNWKVKYDAVTSDTTQNTSFTIVYIGEKAPESFDYTLSAMLSKREAAMTGAKLNKEGFIEESQVNTGSKVQKDEIIIVELSWDGKTEKVELKLN